MTRLTKLLEYMTAEQRPAFRVALAWFDACRASVQSVADTPAVGGRYTRFIRVHLPDESVDVVVHVGLSMLTPVTSVQWWDLFIAPPVKTDAVVDACRRVIAGVPVGGPEEIDPVPMRARVSNAYRARQTLGGSVDVTAGTKPAGHNDAAKGEKGAGK